MLVLESRPIVGRSWKWLSKPATGVLYAVAGLFLCVLLTQCASATGSSATGSGPQPQPGMTGGTASLVPESDSATTASLAAALQSQGFKGLVIKENLPRGPVDVVQTGVDGANVVIWAPACRHVSGAGCSLIFLTSFNDDLQVVTDTFTVQTARKLNFARFFVLEGPNGRRVARLAYTFLYQGEPDVKLVVGALNLLGLDINTLRNAFRDARNQAAK